MSQQLPIVTEHRHTHLRLGAAVQPGRRRPRRAGFGKSTKYSDRSQHGRVIAEQALAVSADHKRRLPVLGLSPELVLVLESNRQLDPDSVTRAGLTILELKSDEALVAFAQSPDLEEFHRMNEAYQLGSPGVTDKGNERQAAYEDLFDCIESMRALAPSDVISPQLAGQIVGCDPALVVRIDVQCWCPEDPTEARRLNDDVRSAVAAAGGAVLASTIRVAAGWSSLLVDLSAGEVESLAAVARVRWIDTMPLPRLGYREIWAAGPATLPPIVSPDATAPIVAVIDSGVTSSHPLLAPATTGVEFVGAGFGDGGDAEGHGTMVASLALYGSLEDALVNGAALRAAGRLLSIRVLDNNADFPDDRNWLDQTLEAMEMAVAAGARVINLSLGDPRRPYTPARPTPAGAVIDLFIREHPEVVVVVSAGNIYVAEHEIEALLSNNYPAETLGRDDSGILDPATAALALTVGALCGELGQGALLRLDPDRQAVGAPGMPSPHSRVGPGPSFMVKPELSAPGGSVVVDTLQGRAAMAPEVSVVGAAGADPARLLAVGAGTSYAAPLVSHACLRVLSRYPALTGNSVRALVLLSAESVPSILLGLSDAELAKEQRRLTGYGRVSADRAEVSTDHRAVMLSESAVVVDEVHLYVLPLPSTFFVSGGEITVSVALAYDPPVRGTRLDYMANLMSFQAYRGVALEAVQHAYAQLEAQLAQGAELVEVPTELNKFRINMHPSNLDRSRGSHHFGALTRRQKFDGERGRELIIAVRNVNRWDPPRVSQTYSLAVAFERDEGHADLYNELALRLEALAEATIEPELEVEAGARAVE